MLLVGALLLAFKFRNWHDLDTAVVVWLSRSYVLALQR